MASKGEMTLLRYLHRMLLFLHLFQSIHRLKNPKLRINLLHPTRLLLPTTCRFHQLNRLDQIIAALLILLFKQRISLLHHLVVHNAKTREFLQSALRTRSMVMNHLHRSMRGRIVMAHNVKLDKYSRSLNTRGIRRAFLITTRMP